MAATNRQLAVIFQDMADIGEVLGHNRFKLIAYHKAARIIEELTGDVSQLDPKAIQSIEGIGKGTAARIREFLDTGKVADHEGLVAQVPPGVVKMTRVPGLGPKTVATLWKHGGVTDVPTLIKKLATDELADLPGLGKKKLEQVRKNLRFIESANQRVRIGSALPMAHWMVEELRKAPGVKKIAYAGSLRRGRDTIGDLDLLVAADARHAPAVAEAFAGLEVVTHVITVGPTKTSVRVTWGAGARERQMQVDLRIVPIESFGAAMMYFTGSKDHNVALRQRAISRGMKLSEYGLYENGGVKPGPRLDPADQASGNAVDPTPPDPRALAGKTEEEVYAALDLQWVPPELREMHGEIALAERGKLPKLLTIDDIRSELHSHTTASDGTWTIREWAAVAIERGFHTIAITDHSRSQAQANGLSAERLEQHIAAVRAVADELKGKITLLAGTEVDILADGRLDYPDSLLKELDLVVASPHAALSQPAEKATPRLLKAIENRYVTILGHPTGRLIGRREGMHPDISRVVKAAADRGIALEINTNSARLDLRDTHARAALDAGCVLAINTDAHGPADLDQLIYGVLTARRAGATAKQVVNCMTASALKKWIASTRP